MLRILLADDHDIVRRGLRELLEEQPGWEVCGEAATGREALEHAIRLRPQVVVLDLMMPELNGLEAARQIRKAVPTTEILVFTMHDSEDLVHEILSAGARGYVLKAGPPEELFQAVREAAAGGIGLACEVVGHLVGRVVTPPTELSEREKEVVRLMADGHTLWRRHLAVRPERRILVPVAAEALAASASTVEIGFA